MKILFHHRIASRDGQYVHIEELTQALRMLGHEVLIVGPRIAANDNLGSESIGISLLKRYMPAFLYEILELAYSLIAYRRLARAVKGWKPDGIYERYNLYSLAGTWARRRFKLPLLMEVNAPLCDERSRYGSLTLKSLARWSESAAWRGADVVLPVTGTLARYVLQVGVPQTRIIVIPNGIDQSKFTSDLDGISAKARIGLQNRLVLGFTGFVREWHGLERVVDVIASNPQDNRHLLIVGDGPARSVIEERASSLGVSSRVTFTGVVDRHLIADYIAAYDIALQPDVVPYASPLKLFEYLAMGLPVAAPDRENIREILTHEHNALLFSPDEKGDFERTIERLCVDSDLRKRIARNACLTISQGGYTWTNNAKRIVALLQQLKAPVTRVPSIDKATGYCDW